MTIIYLINYLYNYNINIIFYINQKKINFYINYKIKLILIKKKMKKIFFFLFVLISFVFSKKLGVKKTGCIAKGGDCDFTAYCCDDYQCKDYRCANKGTPDNQVEWGVKCDWFHHCDEHYNCMSHRCVLDEEYANEENNKKNNE